MTIVKFPNYKLSDIPASLRTLADRIEREDENAVRCIVLMEPVEGGIDYVAFGAAPFTRAHAIGLCFAGGNRILENTND